MNYRNYRLPAAVAIYGVTVALVSCSPAPTTPDWAKLAAPYVALAAFIYAAAYAASRALEAITVRLVESIGASLMVLDQKSPRDDTTAEVCVELDDANQALELRQRLRIPSALPVLDTPAKDWRV